MRRIVGVLFAVGLSAGPALAGELELPPPKLSVRSVCPATLQARCAGVSQGAVDRSLDCERCAPELMPTEKMAPLSRLSPARPSPSAASAPASPAKNERPIECALSAMPLGPLLPGCVRLPLDNVPLP